MRLPDGYRTLRPALADVDEILDLVHATEEVYLGYRDYERSEVIEALTGPGIDPDADSWLVRDGAGRLVGWGQLYPSGPFCDAYARPGEGPSVQAYLIGLLLDRVVERADGKTYAKAGALASEEQYIGVLTAAGFEFDHLQARMSRPLTGDEQPPAPVPGYTLRPMTEAELPAAGDVLRAAFGDQHGYEATPGLVLAECLVAEAASGLAGVLLAGPPSEVTGEGWVKWLGVHPDHRRHGLAAALLATAIAGNARLGRKSVGLGVDTNSPTKAFTLYERLGFEVQYRADNYRVDLGPRMIGG
jgi:ribosomal protein S18 acetylase RimI-like enzyme